MGAARGVPRDGAGHDARIVEIAFRVVGWAVAVGGVALGCRAAGVTPPGDGALTGIVAVGAGIWAVRGLVAFERAVRTSAIRTLDTDRDGSVGPPG